MKIVCQTVESFLDNVQNLGSVYGKRIFVQRSSVPLNGKNNHDATSFEISIQCGVVMDLAGGDGAQALLLCGENCGIDRTTADGTREATARFHELKEEIKDYCETNGHTLLPGTLEM